MNDYRSPTRIAVPAWVNVAAYLGRWAIDEEQGANWFAAAGAIDFSQHEGPRKHQVAARLSGDLSDDQLEDASMSVCEWMQASDELLAAEKIAGNNGQDIAVVKLSGLLMKGQTSMGGTSTLQARRELRAAAADPGIGGILLAIDSPGGTVAGTADLAADIRAANSQKPVFAHIDDLGASAAIWAASQAEQVFANNKTAMIGSIGTVQVMYDASAAAEKQGVQTLVFRTGPLKGMGAPGAPFTDEQKAHVQGLIDKVQEQFDQAVRDGRGLSAKELAAIKHGGVLLASDAKDARLIDAIQPLSRTLKGLSDAMKHRGGNRPDRRAAAEHAAGIFPIWRPLVGKTTNDPAAPPVGGIAARATFDTGRSGAVLPMVARQTLPMRSK